MPKSTTTPPLPDPSNLPDPREGSTQEEKTAPEPSPTLPSKTFDLSRFRISQDYASVAKKVLTSVPVRKPPKQMFVYVLPGEEWRADVNIIEVKEDGEYYLVDPDIAPYVASELTPFTLVTYLLRGNSPALWPIRLPGEDGKDNDWWATARDIATRHAGSWVRVQSNMSLGGYELFEAAGDLGEPELPSVSFPELLRLAFAQKKRIVDSLDHVVVRRLQGEV
ncbi:MAG: hypothetical protein JKY65_14870 [Planctomycetes bacterium]|nr:hypothetical protein [Planctomycetota bacterium]